ncbi:MAG TPA: SIMPL domain-containing protein [Prolixibacteraceae bacterium]|nr:SIMPL domain-containing protein [Prolixibacteraceae bacterium]
MKNLIFFLFLSFPVLAIAQTNGTQLRTINVKGHAEMEVVPDEMVLTIGIQEYWEEEFEKNTKPEDYKTKVPLAIIEDDLIKKLRQAGIDKEDVKAKNVGNYWRQQGKEFLFSKQLEIELHDFSKVNQLIDLLDAKGIRNMNISELRSSEMEKFEKQVKTQALKNAQEKAAMLLESLGEELGEVISISEMSNNFVQPMAANEMMVRSADVQHERIDQIQMIKLEYQVQATFRIK